MQSVRFPSVRHGSRGFTRYPGVPSYPMAHGYPGTQSHAEVNSRDDRYTTLVSNYALGKLVQLVCMYCNLYSEHWFDKCTFITFFAHAAPVISLRAGAHNAPACTHTLFRSVSCSSPVGWGLTIGIHFCLRLLTKTRGRGHGVLGLGVGLVLVGRTCWWMLAMSGLFVIRIHMVFRW